jgi:hypothetical protein
VGGTIIVGVSLQEEVFEVVSESGLEDYVKQSRHPDINLRWTSEFAIMRQKDADWLCTHSGELPNHNCIVKGSVKQERPEG